MADELGTIPYPVWQGQAGVTQQQPASPMFLGASTADPAPAQPAAPQIPTTWTPSTWQPGQPPTPMAEDRSRWPMPTQAQIEQQRQTLYARMTAAGWRNPQLSDGAVISTMTNLPQGPMVAHFPDWTQDYFQRNPPQGQGGAARPGVDAPTNSSYDPGNVRTYNQTGYMWHPFIPDQALVEHYGADAVRAAQQNAFPGPVGMVGTGPNADLMLRIGAGTATQDEVKKANLQNTPSWDEYWRQKSQDYWDLDRRMSAREAQPGYRPDFYSVDAQGHKTIVPPPAGFQTPGGQQQGIGSTGAAPGAPQAKPLSYSTAQAGPFGPFQQWAQQVARQPPQSTPVTVAQYQAPPPIAPPPTATTATRGPLDPSLQQTLHAQQLAMQMRSSYPDSDATAQRYRSILGA